MTDPTQADPTQSARSGSTATLDPTDEVIRAVGLTKTYPPDVLAVDDARPRRAPGRDLRSARPQRRRQVDHCGDAHDPGDPDGGLGLSSPASTWSPILLGPSE